MKGPQFVVDFWFSFLRLPFFYGHRDQDPCLKQVARSNLVLSNPGHLGLHLSVTVWISNSVPLHVVQSVAQLLCHFNLHGFHQATRGKPPRNRRGGGGGKVAIGEFTMKPLGPDVRFCRGVLQNDCAQCGRSNQNLGPPVVPFHPFLGEGTLQTSLEDLGTDGFLCVAWAKFYSNSPRSREAESAELKLLRERLVKSELSLKDGRADV